jgi:hypothetical protein
MSVYIEKNPVPRGKPEAVLEFINTRKKVVVENLLIAGRQTGGYGDVRIAGAF